MSRRPFTELVMWARPLQHPAAEGSLSRRPSRHSLSLHACLVLRRLAWPVHAAVGSAGAAVESTGLLRPGLGTRTPPLLPHPLTKAGPVGPEVGEGDPMGGAAPRGRGARVQEGLGSFCEQSTTNSKYLANITDVLSAEHLHQGSNKPFSVSFCTKT